MTEFFKLARLRLELSAALRAAPWAIATEYLLALANAVVAARTAEELKTMSAVAPKRPASAGDTMAVINLSGVITPKSTLFSMFFGGTALTDFQASLEAAVNNPKVLAIILNVDSPGGMVDLVTETAAAIRAAREVKPVVAVANTDAASAAYWLAAQADELVVTPSGSVGSIGVYTAHTDFSSWEEQNGQKTTLIAAGKYKVEGNPYEPLSEEAAAAMQDTVDKYYGMFTGDVAAGRGVSEAAVRNGYGEGRMLTAEDAKAAGMVDRIATMDDVLAGMAKKLGGSAKAETIVPQTTALKERARYEYHRFSTS